MSARLLGEWRGLRGAQLRAALPRYLATAALLLLVALGLRSLLAPPALPEPPRRSAGADAPSEDFALQFARAYLSYDAARPGLRARALAPFLPQGLPSDAGFLSPSGSQRVQWAEVASDQPSLLGGRTITVAARVSSRSAPIYLALSVRHRRDRPLALLGYPAIVGAPAASSATTEAAGEEVDDRAVAEVAKRALRNYLAGSAANLDADLAPGASVTLPTLPLALRSIERLEWIGGAGRGSVLATLSASDRLGATYTLAYELGLQWRERPYIDFIEVVPTAG